MNAFLRKYLPLLCGAACLLALLGIYIGVYSRRDAGTYRLTTLEGDPAALAPFLIRMEQQDGTHIQALTLDGGALRHRYRRAPLETATAQPLLSAQQHVRESPQGGTRQEAHAQDLAEEYFEPQPGEDSRIFSTDQVQLALDLNFHELLSQTARSTSYYEQYCTIFTDVVITDSDRPFLFQYARGTNAYADPYFREYGWASTDPVYEALYMYPQPHYAQLADGTVYVFPQVFPFCGGEAALYRIDTWAAPEKCADPVVGPDGLAYQSGLYARGGATALAALPLDGQDILTLDLTAVGDKLALLYTQRGVLRLRLYAPDGTMLSEAELGTLPQPTGRYQCQVQPQPATDPTVLCYTLCDYAYDPATSRNQFDNWQHFAVSLEGDGLRPLSHCETPGTMTILGKAYVDNTWVLVGIQQAPQDFQRAYHPAAGTATILLMDAQGMLLYRGELYTDGGEDQIQYIMMDTRFADYSSGQPFTFNRYFVVPEDGIRRR